MKKINILVLGGSQAAKVFAETLPNIFLKNVKSRIRFQSLSTLFIKPK